MIVLYLDYVLDENELVEVQLAVGEPIEMVRIPWLFPVRQDAEGSPVIPLEPRTVRPHLRQAGLTEHNGERVLLVAPREQGWYASLAEAIFAETGCYPLLVQPPVRRQEAGCPGPLRIIDMEAYLREGESADPPPWQSDLLPPDVFRSRDEPDA